MATVTVTADGGQIRITSDLPGDRPEQVVLLLAQALELARIPAIAKQVMLMPKPVEIVQPNGMAPGSHGLRGGDVDFRIGRAPSGG